jgi:hypothetical protein
VINKLFKVVLKSWVINSQGLLQVLLHIADSSHPGSERASTYYARRQTNRGGIQVRETEEILSKGTNGQEPGMVPTPGSPTAWQTEVGGLQV